MIQVSLLIVQTQLIIVITLSIGYTNVYNLNQEIVLGIADILVTRNREKGFMSVYVFI